VRQFPNSTLTLLFTDIEGSTLLLQQLGNQYAEMLRKSLDDEAFQKAWAEGSKTTLDQVVLAP